MMVVPEKYNNVLHMLFYALNITVIT